MDDGGCIHFLNKTKQSAIYLQRNFQSNVKLQYFTENRFTFRLKKYHLILSFNISVFNELDFLCYCYCCLFILLLFTTSSPTKLISVFVCHAHNDVSWQIVLHNQPIAMEFSQSIDKNTKQNFLQSQGDCKIKHLLQQMHLKLDILSTNEAVIYLTPRIKSLLILRV